MQIDVFCVSRVFFFHCSNLLHLWPSYRWSLVGSNTLNLRNAVHCRTYECSVVHRANQLKHLSFSIISGVRHVITRGRQRGQYNIISEEGLAMAKRARTARIQGISSKVLPLDFQFFWPCQGHAARQRGKNRCFDDAKCRVNSPTSTMDGNLLGTTHCARIFMLMGLLLEVSAWFTERRWSGWCGGAQIWPRNRSLFVGREKCAYGPDIVFGTVLRMVLNRAFPPEIQAFQLFVLAKSIFFFLFSLPII